MGEVFLGRDTILGREVAIKTILPESSFGEEARARFEREAKSTALLSHPNIVTVFEFGEEEGVCFLAMEYLEGDTLETLIQRKGLTRKEALEILAQTCEGLAYAHERGVIHRDVKPANILVIRRGKRVLAKLMDFGVALVSQSSLTQQGTWMGTANYMAPEYLDTGKASASSDLFAIGVMLYEVLTEGRKPFSGETTTMVLNAILRHPPEPFRPAEVRETSPRLLEVAHKALAKQPEERFQDAEALAGAIRDALAEPLPGQGGAVVPLSAPPAAESTDKPLIVGRGTRATCLSLRVALRQAPAGARITILPGVYRESLVIDREVTLVGEGPASEIVLETRGGTCLAIQASKVAIHGLTIRNVPGDGNDPGPMIRVQSGKTTLEDCVLETAGAAAVRVEHPGTQLQLKRCHLQGNPVVGLDARPGVSVSGSHSMLQGHARTGVLVGKGASVNLIHTVIRDGEGIGVRVLAQGQAQLEDCEILACMAGSFEVEAEGRANLRRCRLETSRFTGVLALEKGQATMEECEISEHGASGVHVVDGAIVSMNLCHVHHNAGFGLSVMDQGLCTVADSEIDNNEQPGAFVRDGGTLQVKNSKLHDGRSLGVVCAAKGRGVLEASEIYGNVLSGAKVERGGSLLLVRCVLRDGRDTGMLLFEDAELTLEECVVHRNARGGILLSKDASDPVLRGGNQIDDDLLRTNPQGGLIKLAPVKRRA